MSGWLPILTAPRDGRYVLLCNVGETPSLGFYAGGELWDDGDFNSSMGPFTHWHPLPEGPTA